MMTSASESKIFSTESPIETKKEASPFSPSPTEQSECPICLSPVDDPPAVPCGHKICSGCWAQYVQVAVQDRNVNSIRCVVPGCSFELGPCEVRQLGGKEVYKKYKGFIEQDRLEEKGARWCPGCGKAVLEWRYARSRAKYVKGCIRGVLFELLGIVMAMLMAGFMESRLLQLSAGVGVLLARHEAFAMIFQRRRVATCKCCRTKICWDCKDKYHGTSPCTRIDPSVLKWINEPRIGTPSPAPPRCAKCAGCNHIIELYDGCNHVTCSLCGYQFCMICGKELNATSVSVHYATSCPRYNGEMHPGWKAVCMNPGQGVLNPAMLDGFFIEYTLVSFFCFFASYPPTFLPSSLLWMTHLAVTCYLVRCRRVPVGTIARPLVLAAVGRVAVPMYAFLCTLITMDVEYAAWAHVATVGVSQFTFAGLVLWSCATVLSSTTILKKAPSPTTAEAVGYPASCLVLLLHSSLSDDIVAPFSTTLWLVVSSMAIYWVGLHTIKSSLRLSVAAHRRAPVRFSVVREGTVAFYVLVVLSLLPALGSFVISLAYALCLARFIMSAPTIFCRMYSYGALKVFRTWKWTHPAVLCCVGAVDLVCGGAATRLVSHTVALLLIPSFLKGRQEVWSPRVSLVRRLAKQLFSN